MSPAKATERMHNRLYAGATRLRALPSLTADAPSALAHGRFDGCAAFTTADATRHVHDSTLYKPSYAGRLIHADIAGPFVRTHHTGYQYLLMLVKRALKPYISSRIKPKRRRTCDVSLPPSLPC
eukprot:410608-Pleurochrysis_carterae.AAC.1